MSSALSVAAEPGSDDPVTARYSVHALAEAGVMPRLLELFAKRGLVPQRWHSAVVGPGNAAQTIDIEIVGLGRETIDYIARSMRQVVGVDAVLTVVAAAVAGPQG